MAYTKKALEDLNVIDDFLINRLASDQEVGEAFCRVVLSTLLQREIGKVHVTVQKVMPPADPNLKGIRLDVKAEEFLGQEQADGIEEGTAMNIYDIEPHLLERTDLPRHNRFYQALSDSSNLKSGETDYKRLPDLYVLMILNKDSFGADYMMYSIRNRCEEVKEMDYEDGLRFYYFYTGGRKGGSDKIKTMLRYIRDSRRENATDAATKEVHKYTEKVKIRPEVRKSYMLWEEYEYLLKKKLKAEAKEEIREEMGEEIREEVRSKVEGEIREEVRNKVEGEIREEVRSKVEEEIREEVRSKVEEEIREEARKELWEKIMVEEITENILELLGERGKVPDNLVKKIRSEEDLEALKCWLKLAAKVSSVAEFEEAM